MKIDTNPNAPISASYIVKTANGILTSEQALGALASGILYNTTTTGVVSIAAAGTDYAAPNQTMYIGTTAVAINRASAALTLAGITLTTPDIGTPSAGVLTSCTGTAAGLTAGSVTNATLTTALTVNTGTLTLTANVANTSVLTIGAGAVTCSGSNTGDSAANSSTMYIGTTQHALNRASAAETLAGITLTTPDIGTPSAGTLTNCTGLPIAGLTASTSTALGVGSIELGAASDTTIARSGAGAITVEGVAVLLSGGALGTPSSGTVTNLTGTASININGTVGATSQTTIAGTTITAYTGLMPDVDDGAYIGQAGTAFSDLFLAEGGVISWDSGDVTLTQTNNTLNLAGGEFLFGANSAGFTQQTATGDGTTTIDWRLGNKFYFTFGAQSDTFTFTAPSGVCNLLLVLKQDATGSRLATWPNTVKWPAGTAPTLTTAASSVDIVTFYWDGTNYHGTSSLNFSVPA